MTSLFFTSPVKKNISERSLFPIATADILLSLNQCKNTVKNIYQTVGISDEHFNILYKLLIDNFVEFVQLLPVNNEAQLGSLMYEGLLRALFALRLQKEEDEDHQPDPLFVYALFSAALLFDVGYVTNNRTVMISEKDGAFIKEWVPSKGRMLMSNGGDYYRIRYGGGMSSELSRRVTPLFAQQLMPLAGFNWISQNHSAFNIWIALLNNEEVTNDLKSYLDHANKKLLDELPKKIFSVTNLGIKEPEETALGEDFLEWLKNGLDTETININTYDSDIHIVEGGLFLEVPEIIRKFCAQSTKNPRWEEVFAQLKKIGFINLSETSEQLATYTYDYANMGAFEPLFFVDTQKQEGNKKQQTPIVASNQMVRRGVEVFVPCFLFFLLSKRFHLSIEKNLVKDTKEKHKKKLKVLKKLKLLRQRFEERVKEIEEATLLRLNLNKENLEVSGKEFKKWLKKMQTPFYTQ